MDIRDSEFQKRIQETFRLEAEDHLKTLASGLVRLETNQPEEDLARTIEELFREVHSLKGAARSVGQRDIESVCQPFESIFSALKRNELAITPGIVDLFYEAVDFLSKFISAQPQEQTSLKNEKGKELINKLKQAGLSPEVLPDKKQALSEEKSHLIQKEEKETVPTPPHPDVEEKQAQALGNVVRIPVSKLDPLLLQAEEFLQIKISFSQQSFEINSLLGNITDWKDELRNRKRASSPGQWDEWDDAMELRLDMLEDKLAAIARSMGKNQYAIDRMVNDHMEAVKQVIMLPVSTVVETFPSMVREISRNQHKEVELIIKGAELEMDKRILEEIKDPLVHIVRNSIDHGIEMPEVRTKRNKNTRGRIGISFLARESGFAEIIISDDGQGIDTGQVLKAAIKAGAVSAGPAENMNHEDLLSLIFKSGVSTNAIITDLSGRGLGLSIVKEKVEKLNGRLRLESIPGKGTTFHILLPMTLATFRGTLVQANGYLFVLPTMNVDHVLRLSSGQINSIENRDTIRINDSVIPVADLGQTLGIPPAKKRKNGTDGNESPLSDYKKIIVLSSSGDKIAFAVEEVLDEQQVLVKSLGKLLKRVRNISGATILGSGKIVPVLNISDLMKSAKQVIDAPKENITAGNQDTEQTGKILVAEDSITSRTLLKNILETAGYIVTVAVDGADAYMKAKSDDFNLVVSDVDMPRMNGFELTKKIRDDKKLGEIPVILITSLESRDDKERGIEAGANAYIVKSSFDQGNLLDIIKRF